MPICGVARGISRGVKVPSLMDNCVAQKGYDQSIYQLFVPVTNADDGSIICNVHCDPVRRRACESVVRLSNVLLIVHV